MSTNAGTEEHLISGAVLPVPGRTSQLSPLSIPDAPTYSFRNAPLAAYAKDCDCPPCFGNGLTVDWSWSRRGLYVHGWLRVRAVFLRIPEQVGQAFRFHVGH
jgi:hypothetical protein